MGRKKKEEKITIKIDRNQLGTGGDA